MTDPHYTGTKKKPKDPAREKGSVIQVTPRMPLKEWRRLKPKLKETWRESRIKLMPKCPSYEKFVCNPHFCRFCTFRIQGMSDSLFISGKEVRA